ncbi:hypothetical protein WJX73_006177 [Symbiochloris irregularis]|uniref:Major facilitator superfamily (MFS) profile domain-containing protein n=1 Tax=Symbiochloris irregularis TaxID=706552 RepID=A0AAW1PM69_9CHLO
MAGGMAMGPGTGKRYKGRTTPFVVMTCIVAASGGALFGYDNGITGGVVAMEDFLAKFFPEVLAHIHDDSSPNADPYCSYDNQGLQWFTSSLFVAGVAAALPAGWLTKKYGRKTTMLVAGILFDIGVVFITAAWSLWVLILGRVFLGVAVSFASVAVTLYNSEMAPAHIRGRLNQIFQVVLSLGILVAQAINIGTQHIHPYGWRISLAFAGMPAIVLTLGGIFLPDTPNSLIQRGKEAEGRRVLVKIRGTTEVDEELEDIKAAVKQANSVTNPYRTILKRPYRPQLFIACTATLFQQWTGINTVIFYSPQLFVSLGTGQSAALVATIVTGIVNHFATYVSLWAADEFGRRLLFLEAGVQMVISLIIVAATLGIVGTHHVWVAWFSLIFICVYISGYAWSWGPLAWLYPSEVQPLETRSAGQSITTLVNLMFSFVIGQTYLTMLCSFKWGIFLFFSGMIVLATVTVYFLYPETKGLAMEDAPNVFKYHWYWKRFAEDNSRVRDTELLGQQSYRSDGATPVYRTSSGMDGNHGNGGAVPNGTTPKHRGGGAKDGVEVRGSPFHGAPFADYPFANEDHAGGNRGSPATTQKYLAQQGARSHVGENGNAASSGFQDNPFATSDLSNGSPGPSGRPEGLHIYEQQDYPEGDIVSLEVVPESSNLTPESSRLGRREPASDDPMWHDE